MFVPFVYVGGDVGRWAATLLVYTIVNRYQGEPGMTKLAAPLAANAAV